MNLVLVDQVRNIKNVVSNNINLKQNIMLTIAIISLIGFSVSIINQIVESNDSPKAMAPMTAIMTISWWDISFPMAIILLVIGGIWALICLAAALK